MSDIETPIKQPITGHDIDELETIELLFFAYRDFISDPDRILQNLGFGRAHHRTLYFVSRNPGMTVAELLSILKITKQSLARVLRQLIDSNYILQTEGKNDRRKRLLFVTEKGKDLVLALSQPQSNRIQNAFEATKPEAREQIIEFLNTMIGSQK
jgi:DNA-binding MarR family transcriptional regulator